MAKKKYTSIYITILIYSLIILIITVAIQFFISRFASNVYYMNGLYRYMEDQYNDIITNYNDIESINLFNDIYEYDMTVEQYNTQTNTIMYSSNSNRKDKELSKVSQIETNEIFNSMIKNEKYQIITAESVDYSLIMDLLKLDDEQIVMIGKYDDNNFFSVSIPAPAIVMATELTKNYAAATFLWTVPIMVPVCLIFSYSLSKPLRKIISITKKIKKRDFSDKCNIYTSNEFALLGECIDDMSSEIQTYITDIEEKNKKLNEDILLKEKYEKTQKDFISDVSHELKTPISNINIYAEGLKYGLCDTEEQKQEYYDIIIDECSKMSEMGSKLLVLSRIENQIQEDEFSNIEIVSVIKTIIRKFELKCKNTEIVITYSGKEKQIAYFNKKNLDTIITNYLQNAYKYCGTPGIISVNLKEEKDYIYISVYNNGQHINEIEGKNIWNRFYKADKARTRNDSHGIGLSIVRAIMENHNLPYGFYNVNNGVEFYIRINKEKTIVKN